MHNTNKFGYSCFGGNIFATHSHRAACFFHIDDILSDLYITFFCRANFMAIWHYLQFRRCFYVCNMLIMAIGYGLKWCPQSSIFNWFINWVVLKYIFVNLFLIYILSSFVVLRKLHFVKLNLSLHFVPVKSNFTNIGESCIII